MILFDTSIWIDHFRTGHPVMERLLQDGLVLGHPFVLGELALGNLQDRDMILGDLARLPQAIVAGEGEVLALISGEALFGRGIGYVDAHLLASTRLTQDARLLTREKRLRAAAEDLGVWAELTS